MNMFRWRYSTERERFSIHSRHSSPAIRLIERVSGLRETRTVRVTVGESRLQFYFAKAHNSENARQQWDAIQFETSSERALIACH